MDAVSKIRTAGEHIEPESSAGRYVDRPAFAPYYDALKTQAQRAEPVAVKR